MVFFFYFCISVINKCRDAIQKNNEFDENQKLLTELEIKKAIAKKHREKLTQEGTYFEVCFLYCVYNFYKKEKLKKMDEELVAMEIEIKKALAKKHREKLTQEGTYFEVCVFYSEYNFFN